MEGGGSGPSWIYLETFWNWRYKRIIQIIEKHGIPNDSGFPGCVKLVKIGRKIVGRNKCRHRSPEGSGRVPGGSQEGPGGSREGPGGNSRPNWFRDPFRNRLGNLLGALLSPSWAPRGPSWASMDPSWDRLGAAVTRLEALLRQFWAVWVTSWASFGSPVCVHARF